MIKRPTRTKLSERRRDVANFARRFAFKGWTQAAIAWHVNIPQPTVSRDLAANSLLKKGTVPLGRIEMSRRNCSLERDSLNIVRPESCYRGSTAVAVDFRTFGTEFAPPSDRSQESVSLAGRRLWRGRRTPRSVSGISAA